MTFKSNILCFLTAAFLLSGCTSYKKVPYLQNSATVNVPAGEIPLYDARIMPKDLLTITVSTTDPQASVPFNLTVPTTVSQNSTSLTSQPVMQQYLVNNEGEIDFPVLGKLKISGMTKNECEAMLRDRLAPYLKETPIVNVRMVNYKISVLGEVKNPGTFTVSNEKVNVLEALAMAGAPCAAAARTISSSRTPRLPSGFATCPQCFSACSRIVLSAGTICFLSWSNRISSSFSEKCRKSSRDSNVFILSCCIYMFLPFSFPAFSMGP